jgi:hypothetical protein
MPRRSRKMRGGLFGFGESNTTDTTSTGTSWWDKITGKKPTTSYSPMQSTGSYGMGQSSTGYGAQPGMGYGGKKYRKHYMKGGFTSNRAGGLATYAAPISGVKNAQPQAWVGGPEYKGGRTRKYRGGKHRHSKSCKHYKH